MLDYDINDPQTDRLTTIRRETYEEALAKIAQDKSVHLSTHTIDQVATP